MRLKRLPEFAEWFDALGVKGQALIEARLVRIEVFEHFGDAKHLGDGLAELRWKNGFRVYFAKLEDKQGRAVLLIVGGTKNGQQKDIKQARVLLRRYAANSS